MAWTRALRLLLVSSAVVLGCGPGTESVDTDTTAPVSGTNPPLMSMTDPGDTVAVTSTTSTSATSGTTKSTTSDPSSGTTTPFDPCDCFFLCMSCEESDPMMCDPFAQDCPDGQKCSAVFTDVNGTQCVPVGGAGQPGDSCIAESTADGLDDCDKGVMCWDVDDMGMGTCVKLCEGTAEDPICESGTLCAIDGALNLCLPTCSPLLQDCPEGNACYPINDSFVCAPDASGDSGVANDPCQFINVCEAGLMCADAAFVGAPCDQGTGCCTPFCDLTDPVACPNPDQQCVAFYEPMDIPVSPPDAADIGVCGIPG